MGMGKASTFRGFPDRSYLPFSDAFELISSDNGQLTA